MDDKLIAAVAGQLKLKQSIVKQVISLLDEGNTVPFIARYRKEMTGNLDETNIKAIQDTWAYGLQLKERKAEVIRLIDEQGKLTDDLKAEIEKADKIQRLEDLYRPYRQKRRTRATIAKEKGLEPLAEIVWSQKERNIASLAKEYFSEEHELSTVDDVLAGVNDIIAEWISDDAEMRDYIREETWKRGRLETELKKAELDEKKVYDMYYDYSETLRSLVSHRVLAINRGEKEAVLRVVIQAPVDRLLSYLQRKIIKNKDNEEAVAILQAAIEDSYKRLIEPSVEREVRNRLTESAEKQAIDVFSLNLKNLLLQPPLKGRMVLGIDPAFRTGCKLAVIDETGKVHDVTVIYPTAPHNKVKEANQVLLKLIDKYKIELIAIGNGTASRETEGFVSDLISTEKLDVPYVIVNEAGASVYSASGVAREEFPDLEVEERSAVSIARRVQDPLAELVKIDPKSIGVGQYQHDVSQKELNESLSFVVETAVNQVGVNVNTASSSLLQHVAGLSKTTANNIVKKRNEIGKFSSRMELKDVPRLGPKTFEQSIGFLRVLESDQALDQTPIHPESYKQTEQLLENIGCTVADIGTEVLNEKLKHADVKTLSNELSIGEPTLIDIIDALRRPGRDPRDDFPQPLLKRGILSIENLEKGMEMQGTVRNVVDFGAFIDIGVGQDGLVHISKLSNTYIKHPSDVIAVGDVVTVWIDDVEVKRGRISLTMLQKSGK